MARLRSRNRLMADALCDIAIAAIERALQDGERIAPALDALPATLTAPGVSFVTLERDGRLLGCVGGLEVRHPLARDVAEHAVAAAFDDPRLPVISVDDFEAMSVKVSVLSQSTPIAARSFAELRDALNPGLDGVTITAGNRRATFLPSVWEKVPAPDEFLDALWLKAGLRPRTWPRGLRASRYTATEHCDAGPRSFGPGTGGPGRNAAHN
jgi:AmmeMemoRadiSam system protein A